MTKLPEHEIVRAGIGRKFQTPSIYENLSVWSNLEVSFPRGRGVFGALAFKCTDDVAQHETCRRVVTQHLLHGPGVTWRGSGPGSPTTSTTTR